MKLPEFDHFLHLSNAQPAVLESRRQQPISAIFDPTYPASPGRLRGLQFQIDAQQQLNQHPLSTCIKIFAMMSNTREQGQNAINRHPKRRGQPQKIY